VQPPRDNHPNIVPAAAEPIRPQFAGQPVHNNFVGQPKQKEPVTVLPSHDPPRGPVKPTVVTRSGHHNTYRTLLQLKKGLSKMTVCFTVTGQSLRQVNRQNSVLASSVSESLETASLLIQFIMESDLHI